MGLKENMRNLRLKRKLTLEDIAQYVGTTRQTIQKYESGVVANIPFDKIEKIAEKLGTTPAYLMGWLDQEEHSRLYGAQQSEPYDRVERRGETSPGEPLVVREQTPQYDDVPFGVNCDFTLVCKGDSMVNARILNGDIVYIHGQEDVENGEIAAVVIGNETTLKRVYKKEKQLVLLPENPRYEPLIYTGEELRKVRIIGKAVAFHSAVR